jgi:hypothetical protein
MPTTRQTVLTEDSAQAAVLAPGQLVQRTDRYWVVTGTDPGPQGEPGPQGVQGDPGAQGAKGDPGRTRILVRDTPRPFVPNPRSGLDGVLPPKSTFRGANPRETGKPMVADLKPNFTAPGQGRIVGLKKRKPPQGWESYYTVLR